MKKSDSNAPYNQLVEKLIIDNQDKLTYDEIMEMSIGGFYDSIGILQRELLIQQGLQKTDYLIDVGCGSGRLAVPLSEYLEGSYLGIDVVQKLIDYAEKKTSRPDWSFKLGQGLVIPEQDNKADFVCFFSVLTHLRHEESFLYLEEAKRVLKPNGKIVFSFLDFQNPNNWGIFEHNQKNIGTGEPLNQFIGVDAIKIWADQLNLQVLEINRGGKIKISKDIDFDGTNSKETHLLGQSICVLSKSSTPRWQQKINNGLFRVSNRLQRTTI